MDVRKERRMSPVIPSAKRSRSGSLCGQIGIVTLRSWRRHAASVLFDGIRIRRGAAAPWPFRTGLFAIHFGTEDEPPANFLKPGSNICVRHLENGGNRVSSKLNQRSNSRSV